MKWIEDVNYFKTNYTNELLQKIFELCLEKGWEANSHDNIPTFSDLKTDGLVKTDGKEYYSIFVYDNFIWIEDCKFGNEIKFLLGLE